MAILVASALIIPVCKSALPTAGDDVILPSPSSPDGAYTVYFGGYVPDFVAPVVTTIRSLHVGADVYLDIWGRFYATDTMDILGTINIIKGRNGTGSIQADNFTILSAKKSNWALGVDSMD